MNALVVGAGSMGRWLARTVDADVAFADSDPDAASDAAAAVGGRVADEGERFDVVAFAVPMSVVREAGAEHAGRADRAVVDVTGVMSEAVAAMREHAPELERASFHPLFAPDNAPGNVAVVVDAGGSTVDAIRESLADAGNDVFETTVTEHDEAMETVQARAHAAILAYALAADDVRDEFHTPLSGPLQELAEEVTNNTPRVYAEIQDVFGGASDVAESARRIAEADEESFAALYEEAGE